MAPSKSILSANRPKLLQGKKVNKSKKSVAIPETSKKVEKDTVDVRKENEKCCSKNSHAKNADVALRKTNSVEASKAPGSNITKARRKVTRAQSMSAQSDIIEKLNSHERSQLKKRLKQGSNQARNNDNNKEPSKPPFRFGLAPSKPVKNGVAARWNPSVNSRKSTGADSEVEIPSLNETNVKNFEKKMQLQSRRSHGGNGFQMPLSAAPKTHNMTPVPFNKPTTTTANNFSKKSMAPEVATDAVVNEKVLKPSDFKAKKTRGFSFNQFDAPKRFVAPPPPAAKLQPECEVHQQEKPFAAKKAPELSSKVAPQWNRPGINRKNEKSPNVSGSSASRHPPTAVVAPLNQRETTKPVLSPKLNVKPEPNKKTPLPEKIVDDSMIPDEDFNTFIEKDVSKSYVGGGDAFVPVDSFDTFVEKDVPPSSLYGAEKPKQTVVVDRNITAGGDKKTSQNKKSHKSAKIDKKLGHDFRTTELTTWMDWCDACGGVIMPLFGGQHITCSKCMMLCHSKCIPNVSLTCEADVNDQTKSLTAKESQFLSLKTTLTETKDETEDGSTRNNRSTLKEYNTIQRKFSKVEICKKIEEFNQTVKGSQQMTLQDDGETFRGFIRVTMNLRRPVTAQEGSKTVKQQKKANAHKASFYIDKGAMKALHLTSDTTAQKVVEALLNKFKIIDNPLKFALFERFQKEEGHVILRKMLPGERPLFLRLLWGVNSEDKSFILQENETRDINYNEFSCVELTNFLSMLYKEEEGHLRAIQQKYDVIRSQVKQCIKEKEC